MTTTTFRYSEIRDTVYEMKSADPYWSRAIRAYKRWDPRRHGSWVYSIMAGIEDDIELMIDENREEAEKILAEESADQAAYNQDPYAYYGVRRSDF